MTADTTEATAAIAEATPHDFPDDSPFFTEIKARVAEVCGTGAQKLRLRAESVESGTMVETYTYQITLTKTRTSQAGRVPAGVEAVRAEELAGKVDQLHALYQDRIAPLARTWVQSMASQRGRGLKREDLIASPARFGYTHVCGGGCGGAGMLPCPKCRQSGREECGRCRGSGRDRCATCSGSHKVPCSACFGNRGKQIHGQKTEYNPVSNEPYQVATSEWDPCFLCIGSGTGPCWSCSDGSTNCTPCGSSGEVLCGACGGNKEVGCPTCQRQGVVSVIGSVDCAVAPETVTHMEVAEDLGAIVRRTYENGKLAPLLHYQLASCAIENNIVSTRFEAPFNVAVATVVFTDAVLPRSYHVRAFGPQRILTDFDGLLEAALDGDLELLAGATTAQAYFSRTKRQALAEALSAVMRLDVHRASVAEDDAAPAGAYQSADPAFQARSTQVLHAAIGRLSAIYQSYGLLAGVGAGLAVFAGAVLALHKFMITGVAYGAGAALLAWGGCDIWRRFRLRRILGVATYQRARAAHAKALHLKARPVVLLLATGVALLGLARVLPGQTMQQETAQILTTLKSALPTLSDAQLDALATPPATTFIENQAALIHDIDALKRTADAGNAKALALLGRAAIYGIGVPVDLAEADRLIKRAESLDPGAARVARAFYDVEKSNAKSTRTAGVATMKQLAAAGNVDANLYLGLMLNSRQENVFAHNPREAKRYLEAAAAGGSALATEQLATRYPDKHGKLRR